MNRIAELEALLKAEKDKEQKEKQAIELEAGLAYICVQCRRHQSFRSWEGQPRNNTCYSCNAINKREKAAAAWLVEWKGSTIVGCEWSSYNDVPWLIVLERPDGKRYRVIGKPDYDGSAELGFEEGGMDES